MHARVIDKELANENPARVGPLCCLLVSHLLGATETGDDFSGLRGANYVPSYVRNDVQIWMGDVMPILAEEKVGWCFWELMIGRTQFSQGPTPYQGVIYPDGTCFDAAEVMLIASHGQQVQQPRQAARELGLPARRWSTEEAWAWYRESAVAGRHQFPAQHRLQHHGVLASREL